MNLYGTPNTIGTILQCIVLYHYWAGKKGTAQPFTPRSVTIPLQWQFSQGLCSDAFMLLFYIHVWYSIQQLQNTKLLSRNRDKYTVSESLKHILLQNQSSTVKEQGLSQVLRALVQEERSYIHICTAHGYYCSHHPASLSQSRLYSYNPA